MVVIITCNTIEDPIKKKMKAIEWSQECPHYNTSFPYILARSTIPHFDLSHLTL